MVAPDYRLNSASARRGGQNAGKIGATRQIVLPFLLNKNPARIISSFT
jgi:hypothetical protein